MSIKKKFDDVIQEGLEKIEEMEVGSEEYRASVDAVTKLADRAIEMKKLDADTSVKLAQAKEDRKDRLVKNGLTGVSIVGGLGVTIWGALKSWKFEETGTVTSSAGRTFISRLIPRK